LFIADFRRKHGDKATADGFATAWKGISKEKLQVLLRRLQPCPSLPLTLGIRRPSEGKEEGGCIKALKYLVGAVRQ